MLCQIALNHVLLYVYRMYVYVCVYVYICVCVRDEIDEEGWRRYEETAEKGGERKVEKNDS